MIEKGISPPPRAQLVNDMGLWLTWDKWFRRLTDATARIRTYEVTWNPAAVAANTTAEQTVTVTGLGTSDIVTVNKPTHTAGLGIAGARVSAANTLAVTFVNPTAGSIDPPSEAYYVCAIRR